MLKFTI